MAFSNFLMRFGNLFKNKHCGKFSKIYRFYSKPAYTARYDYETLQISSPCESVLSVEINRGDVKNAMNRVMFHELLEFFKAVHEDKQCRAIVVSGAGNQFSVGIDFLDLYDLYEFLSDKNRDSKKGIDDVARKAKFIRSFILKFQESFTAIEKCSKPIISAIHGACVGTAMSLISSTDIRYCSADSYFQIKEIEMGIAPDLGVLQRLPKITGNDSLVKELIYTGRKMTSEEAKNMGLISKVFPNENETKKAAIELANVIAIKSPVAIQGSKVCLRYSRDHSVYDGLLLMADWNMSMLQSEDVLKAGKALSKKSKERPIYSEL